MLFVAAGTFFGGVGGYFLRRYLEPVVAMPPLEAGPSLPTLPTSSGQSEPQTSRSIEALKQTNRSDLPSQSAQTQNRAKQQVLDELVKSPQFKRAKETFVL
jgi:hypothetical protein